MPEFIHVFGFTKDDERVIFRKFVSRAGHYFFYFTIIGWFMPDKKNLHTILIPDLRFPDSLANELLGHFNLHNGKSGENFHRL